MSLKRSLSESEKKQVAARQGWTCSSCKTLLPAAYQVDHTIPLCDGGPDTIANCTAMCANCHAAKTQNEAIARARCNSASCITYDTRTDLCLPNGLLKCTLCFAKRRANTHHSVCSAIEIPNMFRRSLAQRLSQYTFVPRGTKRSRARMM